MVDIMPFGQYKGKSIEQVALHNFGYLCFLVDNDVITKSSLRKRARNLKELLENFDPVPKAKCTVCKSPAFYTIPKIGMGYPTTRTPSGSIQRMDKLTAYDVSFDSPQRFACEDPFHIEEALGFQEVSFTDENSLRLNQAIQDDHLVTAAILISYKPLNGMFQFPFKRNCGPSTAHAYKHLAQHMKALLGVQPCISKQELEDYLSNARTRSTEGLPVNFISDHSSIPQTVRNRIKDERRQSQIKTSQASLF